MAPTILNLIHPKAIELFYEPVILEKALITATKNHGVDYAESFTLQSDPLLSSEQAFQSFLNKLAQICDNQRGGSTVTAFVAVRNPDGPGPIYVFGSNSRTEDQLIDTRDFIEMILDFVGSNPEGLNLKPLIKKTLWHILEFNIPRVEAYLRGIAEYLNECIYDCSSRRGSGPPSGFEQQLLQLQAKTIFPRDMQSDNNAKQKFLKDCETLIKAIHANMDRLVSQGNVTYDKNMTGSKTKPWLELKHHLGRLHSYRKAAEIIVASAQRSPQLCKNVKVIPVLSSPRMPNPIRNRLLTAAEIIEHMLQDDEDAGPYLIQAGQMQKIGLDSIVKDQIRKTRPIVHAEILLHNELLRLGIRQTGDFWNGFRYIGTSKPTCRLCSYYFEAHPDRVGVRPSHLNFYPNWRLPDITDEHELQDRLVQENILQELTRIVRDDVKGTLHAKCPRGKKHDSNTYSKRPEYLDLMLLSSMDSHEKSELYLEKQEQSEREVVNNAHVDGDDDANGGSLISSH